MSNPVARRFAVVVSAVLSIAAISCHGADKKAQWSYVGATGPAKWGSIDASFEECTLGQLQSPIDIPDASARKGDLPSLLFDYKPAPLKIVDNGHSIQVNYSPGSYVSVAG
jgi:carbonic anhydrase